VRKGEFTMSFQGNMFELLDDSSPASRAQKKEQKKAAQAKDASAAGSSVAKSGRGNKSASRGDRGQGRGRGRGRGEGRGTGAPARTDRRGDVSASRSKDRDRRQRDQAHKRGDFGAPDQQGRVKRPYDKFSHSSGKYTKEGGKAKKDGRGPHNWGAPGEEADADQAAEKPVEKAEGDESAEKAEGDAAEAEAENVKEIDYEEFLARKKKEEEELQGLVTVDPRTVDSDLKGLKQFSKKEEDFGLPEVGGNKKKNNRRNQARNGKVNVDKVLRVNAPQKPRDGERGDRGDRGDRRGGGRGGSRGGRGRGSARSDGGNRRNVNLSLADDKDFPTLGGVKA